MRSPLPNPIRRITTGLFTLLVAMPVTWATAGELELRVIDEDTGKPIGARIELEDSRGRKPRIRRGAPHGNHFSLFGPTILPVTGEFQYTLRTGPEYLEQRGYFSVKRDATDNQIVKMKRFVDMKAKGWWSGDPWAERKAADASLLLQAEDLHVLGLVRQSDQKPAAANAPQQTRFTDAQIDSFASDSLRVHIRSQKRIEPKRTVFEAVEQSHARTGDLKTHVQIVSPNAWDLPLALANNQIDSLQVLAPSSQSKDGWPESRKRDELIFPGKHGAGRHIESIYYQALNAGLRIAPSASSLSGLTDQPPGTFRTYVHIDGPFTADAWWDGLAAGHSMITNGPLIIATLNGESPGHTFRPSDGNAVSLTPKLTLHTRDRVEYLEFIKNGDSFRQVRLDKWVKAKGKLDPIEFTESGWLIIRAVTNDREVYRYASTAPFYVEVGDQPRISRNAAQFFLDWTIERAMQMKEKKDPRRTELLPHLRAARDFWKQRVESANAP